MNQQMVIKNQIDHKDGTQQAVVKAPSPAHAPAHPLPAVQHILGNHGVLSRCGLGLIQAKRSAGRPGDACEQEAEHVWSSAQGGQPLPASVRSFFEPRFGHDLGQVRIHSGREAAQASQSLDAEAFACGQSIVFGAGRYAPHTAAGLHLLAHEVAHTIQQRALPASCQAQLRVASAASPLEQVADRAADAILANKPLPGLGTSGPAIHRKVTSYGSVPGKPDEVAVTADGNSYIVVRTTTSTPEVSEEWKYDAPQVRFDWDQDKAWMEVDWCQDTKGSFQFGADVPAAVKKFVSDLIGALAAGDNAKTALDKVNLTPYINFVISKAGWKISVGPQVTVGQGGYAGAGGKVGVSKGPHEVEISVTHTPGGAGERPEIKGEASYTYTFGQKEEEAKCPKSSQRSVKVKTEITYKCKQFVPAQTTKKTVETPKTTEDIVYLYFPYEKSEIEEPRSAAQIARLKALIGADYNVTAITGHASPEGPLAPVPRGRFIGNEELAKKRAAAAKEFLEKLPECKGKPACAASVAQVVPEGKGELYPLPGVGARTETREELPRQVRGAAQEFLEGPAEALHRTPEVEKQLKEAQARGDVKKMEALVYPLLRRAAIYLSKTEVEKKTVEETTPAGWVELSTCPPEVLAAAVQHFKLQSNLATAK